LYEAVPHASKIGNSSSMTLNHGKSRVLLRAILTSIDLRHVVKVVPDTLS
jgi:hypothetical protein